MPFILRHQASFVLGLFLMASMTWIVAIPPLQMPDERAHYIKSCANPWVDQQEGHYGHYYDSSLNEIVTQSPPGNKGAFDIKSFFIAPIHETGQREFFVNAVPNTVLAYAATSIVCHTMTAFGIRKQFVFYAMRVATLATFMLLLLLALRIHQNLFLAISPMLMIPMVINQSVAIGADSYSIATCILAATVIAAGARNHNISAGLTSLTLFLLLNTKTVYLIFAFPLVWVLVRSGILSKPSSLFLHVIAGLSALTLQLFYVLRKTHAESTAQKAAIKIDQLIGDPFQFLMILDASITRKYWIYVQTTIGNVGWLDTPISWFGFYSFISSAAITIFILAAPTTWQRLPPILLSVAATGSAVFASISYRLNGILVSAAGYMTLMIGGVKHQVQHRFIELRNWVD